MTGWRVWGVCVAALLATGCLFHVDRVADPTAAFERAREDALHLQGRPGPAHELNVLAWDPEDEELVRVSLPMWLCRKAKGQIDLDELGDGHESLDRARRKLRFEDVERAGLGILLEVEEDDGERVLVWLR